MEADATARARRWEYHSGLHLGSRETVQATGYNVTAV